MLKKHHIVDYMLLQKRI